MFEIACYTKFQINLLVTCFRTYSTQFLEGRIYWVLQHYDSKTISSLAN